MTTASRFVIVSTLAAGLVALAIGGLPVAAQGPIAFVQVNNAVPQTAQSVVSVPFTAAQTGGNLNVVAVGWNDSISHVQSVTDTAGNSYSVAVGPTVQSGVATQTIYYAKNIQSAPANGNTVTVTLDRAAPFVDVRIAEYGGLDPTNPLDVTAAAQGNSNTSNSGSATTTAANALIVGANLVQKRTTAAGTGFTSRVITSPDGDILEDRIVTTTGSYNATAAVQSGRWIMQMAVFRAAAPAPNVSIAKTHSGSFFQGQTGATYTLNVSNVGAVPTAGQVSVVDTLPAGLTATALSGAGWSCTLASLTCTRSDALAASSAYPSITLTVNVAANAPASVTNTAVVSGGGDISTGNNTANDVTAIQPPPDTQPPTPPDSLTALVSGGGGTAGTFTLVQHPRTQPCSVGTSCAINLTQSVAPGHLLVFAASYVGTSGVYMTGVNKGGTLVPCISCQGSDTTNGGRPHGYILSSQAATSPITVSWSAATAADVEMWEFAYTGSPQFDAGNAITYPSGVTPVGPSFTLSGINDVIMQTCASGTNCTAVTAPYSSNVDFSGGVGWAASINTASGAGPTWSVSSPSVTSVGGIAFGFNTAPCANEAFVDFEGGAPNTSVSEATLRASSKGWKGGIWSLGGAGAPLKFQTAASRPLPDATGRLCGDGTSYPAGAGSRGVQYQTSSNLSYVKYALGPTITDSLSAGVWFHSDLPANDLSYLDVFTIFGKNGADFANAKYMQYQGTPPNGPTKAFQLEVGPCCSGGGHGQVAVQSNTWYWLTLQYNKTGDHVLTVTDTSGNLVGQITEAAVGTTKPDYVVFGQSTDSNTPAPGYVINFDSMKVSLDGTYPLPFTATASSVSQVALNWTASTDNIGVTGYYIERCQGAGCSDFTQIASSATTTYGDSGLAAGASYTYRVRATDAAGNLSTYSNTSTVVLDSSGTPTITTLSPTGGPVGSAVTITGTNFGATQGSSTVTFNGAAATPASWSATSIVVPVPAGATSGNVVVTVNGFASNGVSFSVAPGITTINPTSAPVGTPVTITGTNFGATQGSSTVTFNGIPATATNWSATSIVAPVPAGAATGNLVVTVGGQASNGVGFTVTPTPPAITALNPTSGPIATSVTITGSNFGATQGASTVTFNGTVATPTSWSATSIVAPVPAGATTGSVVVTVGGLASNGVTFTVVVPPAISALNPTSGPVGTSVTISGANFGATQGASTVAFNGTAATPTSWSATTIVVPVPNGATSGNVVVTVGGLASNGLPFTVFPSPTISQLNPSSGLVGTSVTIIGSNFGATQDTSTVTFNGTAATPTSWSATSIVVPVPAGATTGSVVVTVNGLASNGVTFTVVVPPAISALNPTSGPVGTSVTISGTNFGATQGASTVTFNGTAATPTSWSATSIVAPVPAGAATGNVVVTVGGQASNGVGFTVTPTPPAITALNPTSGPIATSVTISGSNFGATQGASAVTFNGATATPTSWSATSIVVPVPAGATTGPVVVTVGGLASNGVTFTVLVPPAISALNPTSGPVGTSVTISGANFGATQGASTVAFNGTAATPTSWNATTIVVPVPNGATSGNVVVTVGGLASNGLPFTVIPTPTVSQLNPPSGPVGTSVTITGSNFGATQDTSTVTFNGTVATPTSWSATSIVVPVPAGATTGPVVVTVNGLASNGVTFTVVVPPAISALNPTSGPVGTSVTISGANFGATQGASTVAFNGTAATPTSWSATTIVVPVPNGATSGNVVVTVGGLASNGLPFTVIPTPTVSQLNPSSGPVGTSVTITGSNFGATQDTSTVTFNGTAATPTSWSATSIVVPVPAGATTGSVVVTVNGLASNGVTFTVVVPPAVSALNPTTGPVGTSITISGTNFGATQGASTVAFNGSAATPTSWSATSIVAPVPAGAATGNVVVTVGGQASNGVSFTVTPTPPAITALNPTSGPIATSVTITGSNFGATQGASAVTFNGTTATPTSWSATSIVVPVPADATTGSVVVTVGGLASNGVTFTVVVPPAISALNPTSGPVGTSITISGTNFGATQGASTVAFNGTAATPTNWSATTIIVPVPAGAATGNVVVTVGGLASNGMPFTVTPTPPAITALNPTSGPIATSVTISGSNFGATQGTSTVTFNGTAASPTSWSGTSIVVPVPSGATTGSAVVTVGGLASNGVNFTVTVPPAITAVNPTSGPIGTSVTITGTNFGATQGTSTVTFNGTTASPTSWSGTSIAVPVPSGATTGSVVVTAGGLTSNGVGFTVTGTSPSITSLNPGSGPFGTVVTIAGANFGTTQGTSTVTFNGTAASPMSWSAASITVPVPNGATSGSVVVTVGGIASNGVGFTVTAAATPAFVQLAYATPQTPQSTVNVTYASAQRAGDLNVVVTGWLDSVVQVQSVTDSKGNAYVRAVGPTVLPGKATQSIYYAKNIVAAAAGTNVVTVVFTGAAVYPDIRIAEYSGINTVNPVDVTAAATGSGTSSNSGSVTTTNPTNLLVGANVVEVLTTGPGTGYTSRVITSPDGDILEDRVVTTVGSYNATAVLTSGGWVMQMVAFRAGSSAPDLTVTKTHAGSFSQGQNGATYTITATNAGFGATSGQVTVVDALPAGLSATALSGSGWTCTVATLTCTRSDALAAGSSYPAVTLTVNVSPSAPTSVTNVATVSGGGDVNSGNNTASDPTPITQTGPDTQPPSTPTLTAVAVSGSQNNLSWTTSTDNVGVTGYALERCTGVGCNSFAALTTTASTNYPDSGLTSGTSYSYRVRATDAAGNFSGYSNTATAVPDSSLGSFTLIQHPRVHCTASSTSCAIPLTQTVGAGHLLVFSASYLSTAGAYMTGVNKGGALTPCISCQGADAGRGQGYILSSSTATSPITVSFNTATTAIIEMWEFAYTGNAQFDAGTSIRYPSGTTPVGPSFTLSTSSNEVIVQTCETSANCTAVSAPYSANADFVSGNAFAAAINTTSGAGPTWSLSTPGITSLGAMAFGFNTTPCTNKSFADFESAAANTSVSEATLRASTRGWQGGTWSLGGTGAPMKFQAAASRGLPSPLSRLCGDGNSYAAGAGSLGLQFLTSTVQSYVKYSVGPMMTDSLSAGVWFYSSLPNSNLSNLDVFTIFGASGGDFANAKFLGGGSLRMFQLEVWTGGGTSSIDVQANTWYWLSLQYNKSGSHVLKIYDSSGALVGTITEAARGTTKPDYVVIGQSTSSTPTSGYVVNFDSMVVSLEGTPLVPTTLGGGIELEQTAVLATPTDRVNAETTTPAALRVSPPTAALVPVQSSTTNGGAVWPVDGAVTGSLYAPAVEIPGRGILNVVYVTTENASVYAFDADRLSSEPLWRATFIDADGSLEAGIIDAPVIDLATGTLYVVVRTKDPLDGTRYVFRLHALDIATGEKKPGGPVVIAATAPRPGGVVHESPRANQRAALLPVRWRPSVSGLAVQPQF